MHHYKTAKQAIDTAIEQAQNDGWSSSDVLQSMLVQTLERYAGEKGVADTRAMLEYELSNLKGTVSYEFVRSR